MYLQGKLFALQNLLGLWAKEGSNKVCVSTTCNISPKQCLSFEHASLTVKVYSAMVLSVLMKRF
jgi:hypothetical protein